MATVKRKIMVVAFQDGRVETYKVTPGTELYFERTYKVGLKTAFDGDQAMTNIVRLAWEAMRAASNGSIVDDFETWTATLEAVDFETENIVPFVKGAGAPPSPPSHSLAE